jgi:hypothetical protein
LSRFVGFKISFDKYKVICDNKKCKTTFTTSQIIMSEINKFLGNEIPETTIDQSLVTLAQYKDLLSSGVDLLELAKSQNPDFNQEEVFIKAEEKARKETNTNQGKYFGYSIGTALALGIGATFFTNKSESFLIGGAAGIGIVNVAGNIAAKRVGRLRTKYANETAMASLLAAESQRLNGRTPQIAPTQNQEVKFPVEIKVEDREVQE